MNGIFTGAFIYADDITLLAPSRYALSNMLMVCEEYALYHDIIFNPSKTKCMVFSRSVSDVIHPPLYFMHKRIDFVKECILLGITLSHDLSDKNVLSAVQKFNRRSNELRFDFKLLPSEVKSQLFTTFCLDAYGCQLWNFDSITVNPFFTAWRKMVRLIWKLPNTAHCNMLHTINNSLPIEVSLEKRCIKLLWSNLNSDNAAVQLTTRSSIRSERSVMGDNYRYFSYKYDIKPYQWFEPFCVITKCITRYISFHVHHTQDAFHVRELCLSRDSGEITVLTSTEMSQLIEYLCTI